MSEPEIQETREVAEIPVERAPGFDEKVAFLMEQMKDGEGMRDRVIAETYVMISEFDTMMRMFAAAGGPLQAMKMLKGLGGNN